jgi:hypothetical protein
MQVFDTITDVYITDAVPALLELHHLARLRIFCLGDVRPGPGAAACTLHVLSDTLNDDEARFQPETFRSHLPAARPFVTAGVDCFRRERTVALRH